MATLDPRELRCSGTPDKPLRGQWHCGPNPSWVTITHSPTGMQVRAYGESQHKAKVAAMFALEYLVDEMGSTPCRFPERLTNA